MKTRHAVAASLCCLAASGGIPAARAYIVNITNSNTPSVYLRVGDGVYTGTFSGNGTPGSGGPVNKVSVIVPAAVLGNGTARPMTSDATQGNSSYDGFAFCNLPSQVYIGGYNRGKANNSGDGRLTVTSTSPLTNGTGDTIPFTQISWTSSGNGDGSATQPFPTASFNGGTQLVGDFPLNTWRESCHSFSYTNSNIVAAGTYTGRVTYTLSVP